ncbi:hypothetical protein SynROS8604_03517 [Synechococcus sp. ROS8604]|nr:hypothetical protein SynROS8604_03517 [Synechococcus sp. ROS8604]
MVAISQESATDLNRYLQSILESQHQRSNDSIPFELPVAKNYSTDNLVIKSKS